MSDEDNADEYPGFGILVSDTGVIRLLTPSYGEDSRLHLFYTEMTYNEAAHLHNLLGAVIE